MGQCRKLLTVLIVVIGVIYALLPDLETWHNDITAVERIVNFFVWGILTVDHFVWCTMRGHMYYSIDFNENPYSVAEPTYYFAEKVRLWMHEDELEAFKYDHGGRNYDMAYLEADEILSLSDGNARIGKLQEATNNYLRPIIIKNWVDATVLAKWQMPHVANNYSNDNVTVRQWEHGCELGHIDKTYRKSLNCEMHDRNLKETLDDILIRGKQTGLAHTIVSQKSQLQKDIFEDFNILSVFKMFSHFNVSTLPSWVPNEVSVFFDTVADYVTGLLPDEFKTFKINMFDEMTAFFATPTYWYNSVPQYKAEEMLQTEPEFVRRQGAQLHNAFLGNIFANVEGRKVWMFISPEYSMYLRGMSTSYGFATFSFIQYYLFRDHFGLNISNFSDVDSYYNKDKEDFDKFQASLFNQEYQVTDVNGTYEAAQKYSSYQHLRSVYETIPKYEITLEQGDLLYFPPFWWHCVKNYEASLDQAPKNYAHSMNFAIANRLIFTFKALQVNAYDWFHSIFLFSFKQFKGLLFELEVDMPKRG